MELFLKMISVRRVVVGLLSINIHKLSCCLFCREVGGSLSGGRHCEFCMFLVGVFYLFFLSFLVSC